LRTAQGTFERQVAQPLREMAAEMKQEAAAKPRDVPPMADWQQRAKRAGEEMTALAQRLKALEEAQRQSASGAEEALAKLRQELAQLQAAEAIRELGPLRAEAAALQKTLQKAEEHQVEQLDSARGAHESAIPEHVRKQEALEQQAAAPLAEAGELLEQQGPQRMKPQRPSADEAHAEEGDEHPEPPREQNAPAPPATKAAEKSDATAAEKAAQKPGEKPGETEETRLYEPALGGPRPQLDPQLATKRPPETSPPPASPSAGEAPRAALSTRQFQKLTELDTAQQSLGSDVQTLDKLISQLKEGQAAHSQEPAGSPPASPPGQPQSNSPSDSQAGQPPPNPPNDSKAGQPQSNSPNHSQAGEQQPGSPSNAPAGKELSQLMQSPALERAMAMAQRLRAAQAAARGEREHAPSSPSQRSGRGAHSAFGARGPRLDEQQIEQQLRQLDPATRTMLLKMQPRVREELLQGMREEGPEGYRQFIREYFQRLTEVHGPHDR
jgi:hypothetical protein